MKERSRQTHQSNPHKGRNFSIGKTWLKVSSGTHPNDLKGTNSMVENAYHRILKVIKDEMLEPDTKYFERDYKYDFSESFALHSFICDSIYLHLECDHMCEMHIEYEFYKFPHEAKVLKLLRLLINMGFAVHKCPNSNLPAFFKGVVSYQEPKYIHTLKPTAT